MKKAFRIISIIVVVVVLFAAIIASMSSKPSNAERIWDAAMTIGNPEAKNYFVVYSDIVCPYCVAFENAIIENEEEFQQYIKDHDILLEVRVSDFLYEYGESNPISSRHSAIAAYCAKDEGKFWDYYNLTLSTVWNDYFKKYGKSAFGQMAKLDKSYWIDLGTKVGLGEDFANCVKNENPLAEIEANAAKTAKIVSGLPSFKFNNYSPPGFAMDGTWEDVKAFFKAGLES